jgi:rare lipoprotein A
LAWSGPALLFEAEADAVGIVDTNAHTGTAGTNAVSGNAGTGLKPPPGLTEPEPAISTTAVTGGLLVNAHRNNAKSKPQLGRELDEGIASWYGPRFHGRRTASGERFNRSALTAAHKTLPLGARVMVSNPRTGKQIVVRINDRGPYLGNRILDLSEAAAQALGLKARGRDWVVMNEVLSPDDDSTAAADISANAPPVVMESEAQPGSNPLVFPPLAAGTPPDTAPPANVATAAAPVPVSAKHARRKSIGSGLRMPGSATGYAVVIDAATRTPAPPHGGNKESFASLPATGDGF